MRQRIYLWMEKLIERNDRKIGLKTRNEAMAELVETSLELEHMKLDMEPIPDVLLILLHQLFSEEFHKATTQRPRLDLAEQEKSLQLYLNLAVRSGKSAQELLDMDHVEFNHFLVKRVIQNRLAATECRSNVSRFDRTTLLHSVSDAAEAVGL